jgi:hypothetical protein
MLYKLSWIKKATTLMYFSFFMNDEKTDDLEWVVLKKKLIWFLQAFSLKPSLFKFNFQQRQDQECFCPTSAWNFGYFSFVSTKLFIFQSLASRWKLAHLKSFIKSTLNDSLCNQALDFERVCVHICVEFPFQNQTLFY